MMMSTAPTTSGAGPVGLWTEPGCSYTIVLAQVRSYFFAREHDQMDDDDLNTADNVSWETCLPAKSKYFVVKFTDTPPGDSGMWWKGKNHREIGMSFVQALATYWETHR